MKQMKKGKPAWVIAIFALLFLILLFSLIKAILEGSHFVIDALTFIAVWVLLFFYYQRWEIRDWLIPFIALSLFMSIAGLYKAYDLVFLNIGYDKYLHIITAFAVTVGLSQVFMRHRQRSIAASLILAFLVISGLSMMSEVGEFIGSVYFGISQGFLTQAAGEAYYPISDLVRYDSHWDMIFSMIGGLLAVIVCSAIQFFAILKKSSRGVKPR